MRHPPRSVLLTAVADAVALVGSVTVPVVKAFGVIPACSRWSTPGYCWDPMADTCHRPDPGRRPRLRERGLLELPARPGAMTAHPQRSAPGCAIACAP